MATVKYRGDAQPIRQISRVTVTNVGIGDVFKITCNRKTVSFTATETSETHVYAGLAALVGDNATIAEFTEMTPATTYNGIPGLYLYGPEDGTPFTISVSKANADTPGVVVTTQVEGSAGVNAQQTVIVTATGGTFTLGLKGITSAAIDYDETAANIETVLEGLASIGVGNVLVADGGTTGNQRTWIVTFVADLGFLAQPLLVADGGGLTGTIEAVVTEVATGAPATNHKYTLRFYHVNSASIRFTFTNPLTGASASRNFSLAAGVNSLVDHSTIIQNCLAAMTNIGSGNVLVTTVSIESEVGTAKADHIYRIEFVGALAGVDITSTDPGVGVAGSLAVSSTVFGLSLSLTEFQQGDATGTDEKQTITFSPKPSGGTFTATYKGQTTAAINHNASAGDFQTALEGLSNIAPGDVVVTSTTTPGGFITWTVTFAATLAAADQPNLIIDTSSLTGGPAVVTQTQGGVAGGDEVKVVTFSNVPTGGTFTLSFGGQTTGNIAYDAAASVIQTALEALSSILAGNVSVTGSVGGPFTVAFIGDLRGTNVGTMSGDGTNLTSTGAETISLLLIVSPTGPAWYSEPNNWSGGAVPSSGDTIIFEATNADCLYGIVPGSIIQSATVRIDASYTGRIGLQEINPLGYVEYRDKRLRIGDTGGTVTIRAGEGDGDGSERIRIDTGAATTTIDVFTTDSNDDESIRAFDWQGTHASNVARVHGGEFSAAPLALDSATLLTVLSATDDSNVLVGPNASVATLNSDGDLLTRCPITTALNITGGTAVTYGVKSGLTVDVSGDGTWESHDSGTIPACNLGPGTLDLSSDRIAKTITALSVRPGAELRDPNKVLTITGLTKSAAVESLTAE